PACHPPIPCETLTLLPIPVRLGFYVSATRPEVPMQHTIEQSDDLGVKVAITLEPQEVQGAFDEVFNQWKNEVALPGFRKGKAPRKLVEAQIEKRMGRSYYVGSALERAIEKSLREVLAEENVAPYTPPHVHPHDIVEAYKEGEPFKFEAEFTRRPDVPEFVHKGVLVQIPKREITENDLAMSLENIRLRLGESTPITDRAAEPGDWAHIRLQAWQPGVDTNRPPLFDNELDVQVKGERSFPFLEDHLIGLKPGETTEATEVVPADFVQPPFPTETMLQLKVELLDLTQRTLPELTDDLVKEKIQVYSSVEELREAIRAQLSSHLQSSRQDDLRMAVESQMLQTVQFVMPQVAVQNRYEDIKNRTVYQHRTEGIDLEAQMEADEQVRERWETMFWDAAEKGARLDFIADAIADREKLEVSDQELANYVYELARVSNLGEDEVKKLFGDRNFLMHTYTILRRRKAWHSVLVNAEVEEVPMALGPAVPEANPLLEAAMDTVEQLEALVSDATEEAEPKGEAEPTSEAEKE
ncbi:MAG TPA: trigger factor, partial [bacterium]|nr:trigger factor [bacterium]